MVEFFLPHIFCHTSNSFCHLDPRILFGVLLYVVLEDLLVPKW
ncbi:unnamed protein product [Larinioides sclopetarius]|uniref:Uncharacterized protein n=1 Tax=Larinioides sclopetarius TaxID=280406 RepID=A0AAV2AP66_9ARAC